ncbi:MAG TPA: radical SAM/SPASM domain-containing protein [Candidatus Cloacimonadota bacterium]|nr:radical SAM/SPASM domain-containing protein [Candidatus Cloacimonadota bacterium]
MPGTFEQLLFARAFARSKRLQSLIGIYSDYYRSLSTRKVRVQHYPPALMIEPTNICNLSCPLCPSGNGSLKRARGMMPLSVFQNIVDQVSKHTGMLILWNQGESFLNPDFYSMIEYASSRDLYTMASTNASLELDHRRIIQSGLSKIIVSMDGFSEDSYNNYRINGNYQLVLHNLQELMRSKRELGSKTPIVIWQFIIMKHNEHEIELVKQAARNMGIDKLEIKTVQIYSKDDLQYLPSNHRLSRYRSQEDGFELRTKLLNRCRRLWTQPVINWDGELSICCYDKDLSFRIGNLKDSNFWGLWTGDAMNRMRQNVLLNRAAYPICRNCGEGIIQKLHI